MEDITTWKPWSLTQAERSAAQVFATATGSLSLPAGEVHLWRASLDSPAWAGAGLLQGEALSADEKLRASRYRFERDRHRYVVRRSLLRSILACYLGKSAGELRFLYNAQGKPVLDSQYRWDWLQFNLSHSDGLALYALVRERRIGVDVERLRMDFDYQAVAKRFFTPEELDALRAIPESEQAQRIGAFFACWTRKEALIKASGEGLSAWSDSQDGVRGKRSDRHHSARQQLLTDAQPAASGLSPGGAWWCREIQPASGYLGSLCVEGVGWQLSYLEAVV